MQKDIMSYLFQLLTDLYLWFILRVRTESWIHWNFPNNFPDLEKSLEKWWIVLVFFFQNFRFHQILFNLALMFAVHYKKNFVLFITYYFDNLQFGKRNYCLEKNMEKSLEFWFQKSVWTLYTCVYVNVSFFCNARSILSD